LTSYQVDKPFFDFDEAYFYQITEKESEKYSYNDSITPKIEKIEFYKISHDDSYPKLLDDKWFFEKIEKYYPRKQKIEKNNLKKLSDIFTERKERKTIFGACDPIYRNIFIFKKEGKVVGISKICFGCLEEYTIGTNRNTKNFGSQNEYKKLEKLVKWSESR
jgi:hypothetical protein